MVSNKSKTNSSSQNQKLLAKSAAIWGFFENDKGKGNALADRIEKVKSISGQKVQILLKSGAKIEDTGSNILFTGKNADEIPSIEDFEVLAESFRRKGIKDLKVDNNEHPSYRARFYLACFKEGIEIDGASLKGAFSNYSLSKEYAEKYNLNSELYDFKSAKAFKKNKEADYQFRFAFPLLGKIFKNRKINKAKDKFNTESLLRFKIPLVGKIFKKRAERQAEGLKEEDKKLIEIRKEYKKILIEKVRLDNMNEFLSQEEFNKKVDDAFNAAGVYEDIKHTGDSNRWLKKTRPEIEAKIKDQKEENNQKRKSIYETAKANYNTNVFTPVISSKVQSNNQQNSTQAQAQAQSQSQPQTQTQAQAQPQLQNQQQPTQTQQSSNAVNSIIAGLPPHLLANALINNKKTK